MEELFYQTIVDVVDGTTTYKGYADLGRATTDPYWRIEKIVTAGGVVTTMYPCSAEKIPSSNKAFRWSERATLTFSLTPDIAIPTLTTVTIASDNSDTTKAKVGDTITLTIVANEKIETPTVTIAGKSATVTAGATTKEWTATYTMTSAEASGTVTFLIAFEDASGNHGVSVSAVTGGSNVIFDKTAPTVTTCTIASNNADTTQAKTGDVITLTFITSENIVSKPTVTIAGHAIDGADVTQGGDLAHWSAVYTMVAGDTAGAVPFTINGVDATGNLLVEKTTTTNGSSVNFDKTALTISSAIRNSNTELEVTLSELAKASTITKANDGGFVVAETGAPGTTYAVSAIAPGATNDKVVLTIANSLASALAGLTVTYATGGNGTVSDPAGNVLATDAVGKTIAAWDSAPEMVSAERLAATTLKVYLSEDANDSTITKANDGGFVVHETGAPATTYAVSAIAKSGSNSDEIELTVADVTASAAAGLTVKYTAGGNGTVADTLGFTMETDATGVVIAAW